MPICEAILLEFDQEMANTRKVLERVPEGNPMYKPHERSMELGRLAGHVAELPGWATTALTTERLSLTPDMKPFIMTTRAELLAVFDKNVAEARKAIESTSDEDFGKVWSVDFNGKPVMSMPRTAVLRMSVMNHLIHHRAQLGVYLRLNNVEVPGMYGPSADEPQWWKEAAKGA